MTAVIFPSSPALAQVFTFGPRSWVWNGFAWESTYLYAAQVDAGEPSNDQTIGYVFINGGTA